MTTTNPEVLTYDDDALGAGWDSPIRAQRLVEGFIVPGSLVLDVGIGTGLAVKGYQEKGASVIGIDHDPAMIKIARAATGVTDIRLGDVNSTLPIVDLKHNVDVVQAIGVLEFVNNIKGTIAELTTCLKDDGVIVFTVELAQDESETKITEYFPDPDVTVFRHSSEQVKEILEDLGLNLLYSAEYGGYTRGDENVPYAIFLARRSNG